MPCDDWCSLLERYRGSVKAYNESVESLGSKPGAQFNQLWHRAETARIEVGLARAALLTHEHNHSCLSDGSCLSEGVASRQVAVFQESEEWVLGDQGQSGG
jgi:hypothetical protein